MKILVTGGAGFIGSHLTEALVKQGHDVRVLDDLSSGHVENLRAVRADVDLRRGDCADLPTARRAVKGMEAVFHEAAVPSVARSVKDPALAHRSGATATINVLLAARDAGVRRVVYAGSSSVYGNTKELPKRETLRPRPLSPYAVSKLAGEEYLRIFAELYGLETLTLRYFNVFGPRQDPGSPYSGVISLFTTALLRGERPVIYGNGHQSRDFTYVANVVKGNLLALRAKGARGQAVNLATGRRITLLDLLSELGRITGRPARAELRPPREGDVRHSLADIALARRLLGYKPSVSFEDGLRRTVEWYRSSAAAD
ncbi:MAG TPA: SDR family oxidoreductase [Vicinamibacteria bacterium]|nr:SDR family oxidoreductase [Vicinamibacteria bacterium]